MASVFFMQPLGQIAGNLVSLIVIAIARSSSGSDDITRTVDSAWRWVLGIGVIPGAIATLFRFAIPESPRYLVEIEDDPVTAEFDATTLFNDAPASPAFDTSSFVTATGSAIQMPPISSLASYSIHEHEDEEFSRLPPATLNSHWRLARTDIVRYFWTEGNWRSLLGTSLSWLLLDFGFYGIGLSSPQFLAKTWGQLHITQAEPNWMTDSRPNASVYQMFFDTSVRGLIVLNIGSFVGGLLLILFAHRIDRVALQKYMFLGLAALFIALGSMFTTLYSGTPAVVALYIIGQILFNFGKYTIHPVRPGFITTNHDRPKRNNLYDPRRDISNEIQRYMSWIERWCRKARLYSRSNFLDILSFRYRTWGCFHAPSRHNSFRFQCLYDSWCCCHSLLDSFASARERPKYHLGWEALHP